MPRPVLLAVMGLPGAGKTAVAVALRAATGAARVSRDDLRAGWDDGPLGYGESDKARLFAAVLEAAGAELAAGRDVVVEGMPFSRTAEREAARALARGHDAGCVLALLDVPVAEARRRVEAATGHVAQDRRPGLVDDVAARFAPVDAGTVVVDARADVAVVVGEVRRAIEAARAAG
jgi:predicted kinase